MILSKNFEIFVVGARIVFSIGRTGIPSYFNIIRESFYIKKDFYSTLCVLGLKYK